MRFLWFHSVGFVFHTVKYVFHTVVFISHTVGQRKCRYFWEKGQEEKPFSTGAIRLYLPDLKGFHTFFTQLLTLYADFSYLCIQIIKKQKEL